MRARDTMDDLRLKIERGEDSRWLVELHHGQREPIRGTWNGTHEKTLIEGAKSLRGQRSGGVEEHGDALAGSLPGDVRAELVRLSSIKYRRRLLLESQADLTGYVWEALNGTRSLFLEPGGSGWSLVRYVKPPEGKDASARAEIKTKLRVLLLLGEQPVDGEAVACVRAITESLAGLGTDRVEVMVAGSPRAVETLKGSSGRCGITALETSSQVDELFKRGGGYHLVHYFGHSDAAADAAKGLALGGALGWLGKDRLARLLKDGPTRVVVLSACWIGESFARELLESVDHVIGTTCLVPADRAARWSGELHRLLAEYRPIDEAVTLSRGKLLRSDRDTGEVKVHLAWAVSHWTRTEDREAFTSPEEVLIGVYKQRLGNRLRVEGRDIGGKALFAAKGESSTYLALDVVEPDHRREGEREGGDPAFERGAFAELVAEGRRSDRVKKLGPASLRAPGRRYLIEAGPGAGKTTLLQAIAWEELGKREGGLLPLFVRVSELVRSERGLWLHLAEGDEALARLIETRAKSGLCILLLDGFDEVKTAEAGELERKLAVDLHRTPVVASARVGYQYLTVPGSLQLKRVRLAPLDRRKAKQLLGHFIADEDRVEQFQRELSTSFLPLDMGGSPFFLSLVGWMYGLLRKPLPDRIVDVYKDAVYAICAGKLRRRGDPRVTLDEQGWRRLLEDVSFHLLQGNERGTVSAEGLHTVLKDAWAREERKEWPGQEAIEDELSELRILTKHGDHRTFLHSSIQEYLAARYLARDGHEAMADDVVNRGAWLAQWELVIAFYAGVLDPRQGKRLRRFVDVLLETPVGPKGEKDDYFGRRAWVAAIGLGLAKRVGDSTFMTTWTELARRTARGQGRGFAMALVFNQFDSDVEEERPRLLNQLFRSLSNSHSHGETLEGTALFGGIRGALERIFDHQTRAWARGVAARCLIGVAEATEALEWSLRPDREVEVPIAFERAPHPDLDPEVSMRRAVIRSLRGASEAREWLQRLLDKGYEPDWQFRLEAADSLVGIAEARDALEWSLDFEHEPEGSVRAAAARSLAGEPLARTALERALNPDREPSPWVRSAAARSLSGLLGPPDVLERWLEQGGEQNSGWREAAVWNLAAVPEARVALERRLDRGFEPNEFVRVAAAMTLAGVSESRAALERALDPEQEPVWQVREAAAKSLTGMAESRPALERALDPGRERDAWVRSAAAQALRGESAAREVLERSLDPHHETEVLVRMAAAGALAHVSDASAALLHSLDPEHEPRPFVRAAAARSLAGVTQARQALEQSMNPFREPHPGVRAAVAESLARLPEAQPALEQLLNQPGPWLVRYQAARSLASAPAGRSALLRSLATLPAEDVHLVAAALPFPTPDAVIWPDAQSYSLLSDRRLVADVVSQPIGANTGCAARD